MNKDYLLSLGCFIDNEYLDGYLELVEKPFVYSEDATWLVNNYTVLGIAACADYLHRSIPSIKHKIYKEKLKDE